jgi:hypothetical protein
MRNDPDAAEIDVRMITELRTLGVKSDPNTVVLQIASGKHVAHYCLALSDLAALAARLGADAALLGAGPRMRFA